jgi:hypothetical protein
MLRRVALVRTNISEENISSIISVTKLGELGRALVINNNLTKHRRENFKSYIALTGWAL